MQRPGEGRAASPEEHGSPEPPAGGGPESPAQPASGRAASLAGAEATSPDRPPAEELADLLDSLAETVRAGGADALLEGLPRNTFQGMLRGLLAGYLAGREVGSSPVGPGD